MQNLSLSQTAQILSQSEDEILFLVQSGSLPAVPKMDSDIVYNDDGTVVFVEGGDAMPVWEFEMETVLEFKKVLDEGFVTKVKEILE